MPTVSRIPVRIAAAAVSVLIAVTGCTTVAGSTLAPAALAEPPSRPSVLMILVGPLSAADAGLMRATIVGSARPGERLIAVSLTDGKVLGSFTAPRPPAVAVPGAPVPPRDPTSYQRAHYLHARAAYRATLRRERAALRARERSALSRWADQAARAVTADAKRLSSRLRPAVALATAVTAIATLQETGVRTGSRRVLALFGLHGSGAFLRSDHVTLGGAGVAVADRRDGSAEDAALQANLLQAGASSAVVLTPATDGQLPEVVDRALYGTVSYKLTHINYGVAQYRLPAAADAALKSALLLLKIRYPNGTATVNGYTDDVPVPGGNVALSWKRADAVVAWLIQHGIASERLLAVGHGAADPEFPDRPGGQPRNRRVVIVILPGS